MAGVIFWMSKMFNTHRDLIKMQGEHLGKRIDGLDKRLDGFDKRMDRLDGRIDGLDTRIDGLSHKVDGLRDEVHKLGERVAKIEGHIGSFFYDFMAQMARQHREAHPAGGPVQRTPAAAADPRG